jgi:tRNA G10  N-methylase Trm11
MRTHSSPSALPSRSQPPSLRAGRERARHAEPLFAALTFAGLGRIARRELAPLTPSEFTLSRLRDYDLLSFRLPRARVAGLSRLLTVEDVFLLLGDSIPMAERRDLAGIEALVTREAVLHGLTVKNAAFQPRKPKTPSYNAFVKQSGDSEVFRRDIAERIVRSLDAAFPRWNLRDPASVEIWGFHIEGVLRAGLRLSSRDLRSRGEAPIEREGALRPTIAAAMAFEARLRDDSTIVDPMCGAGSLLREAARRVPNAKLMGGDQDPEALATAARTLRSTSAKLIEWDARALPLPDAHADAILCNLPFGRQYSSPEANRAIYPGLMNEWWRVLKPGGRMILLSADEESLLAAVAELPGAVSHSVGRVRVLGLWAAMYRVEKPSPSLDPTESTAVA